MSTIHMTGLETKVTKATKFTEVGEGMEAAAVVRVVGVTMAAEVTEEGVVVEEGEVGETAAEGVGVVVEGEETAVEVEMVVSSKQRSREDVRLIKC